MAFATTFVPVVITLGIEIITVVIVSIGVAPTVTTSVTTSTLAYAIRSLFGNADTTDLDEMARLAAIMATRFIAARMATSKSTTSSASEPTATTTARDAVSIVRFLAPIISIVLIGTTPVASAVVIRVCASFTLS